MDPASILCRVLSLLISMPLRPSSLNFRSYGQQEKLHAHDHVQIVLPVVGELEIEVEGTAERVHRGTGIFLAPGRRDDQFARGTNRFLVVDCDPALIDPKRLESSTKRPTLPLSEGFRRTGEKFGVGETDIRPRIPDTMPVEIAYKVVHAIKKAVTEEHGVLDAPETE
jgi:hypothetical protein